MKPATQLTIGRVELIRLPDHGPHYIPAKVDTGADISSIWASNISVKDGKLQFVLFAKGSQYYTGKTIILNEKDFTETRVVNSFGEREFRYLVKLPIRIARRRIKASLTLANRSGKIYPILIGRRLLQNKFLVDVSKGKPLRVEEKERREKLQIDLKERREKLQIE